MPNSSYPRELSYNGPELKANRENSFSQVNNYESLEKLPGFLAGLRYIFIGSLKFNFS